jgi:hypothetical protein
VRPHAAPRSEGPCQRERQQPHYAARRSSPARAGRPQPPRVLSNETAVQQGPTAARAVGGVIQGRDAHCQLPERASSEGQCKAQFGPTPLWLSAVPQVAPALWPSKTEDPAGIMDPDRRVQQRAS